jgi:mannose PTS system EIIA component
MSVGVLILSHTVIGSSLLGTAMHMLTDSTLAMKLLSIEHDSDPGEVIEHTKLLIEELDCGDGVLILTDLYGSTACNITTASITSENISAVSGLNLSMLIKIMNYPELSLAKLVDKAICGGKEGIKQIKSSTNHAE